MCSPPPPPPSRMARGALGHLARWAVYGGVPSTIVGALLSKYVGFTRPSTAPARHRPAAPLRYLPTVTFHVRRTHSIKVDRRYHR